MDAIWRVPQRTAGPAGQEAPPKFGRSCGLDRPSRHGILPEQSAVRAAHRGNGEVWRRLAMNLRRFNAAGTEQFRAYLHTLREYRSTPLPSELIADVRFSEAVDPAIAIASRSFVDKFEAGDYLYKTLLPIP